MSDTHAMQDRRELLRTSARWLTFGGLGLATLCRWRFQVLLACVAAVVTLYNLSSKRLGVFKQLIVSALMISFYPLALAQAGGVTSHGRLMVR